MISSRLSENHSGVKLLGGEPAQESNIGEKISAGKKYWRKKQQQERNVGEKNHHRKKGWAIAANQSGV